MQPTLFEAQTPLGWVVRTTASYWQLIEKKHPEIIGKSSSVRTCLMRPKLICVSKQDTKVFLFYRKWQSYHLCAIAKKLNGEGFLITAYITDKIKEGEIVWPTSA